MLNLDTLKFFIPFCDFDRQFLLNALQHAHVSTVPKGTIIFKRGRLLPNKYFLLKGDVSLVNSEFNSEKVVAKSDRSAAVLNTEEISDVSAMAKTTVVYFSIDSTELAQLEKLSKEPEPDTSVTGNDPTSSKDNSEFQVRELEDEVDWMSCLLKSPLFERIPTALLQELFLKFETVDLEAGDFVVKEGTKGDFFYVMASGRASVQDRSGSINVDLQAGCYFGEESLISSAPRNASVKMVTGGVLKRLNADDFISLVKRPVVQYLDPQALLDLALPFKILDVRMPIEYRADQLPDSINVPLSRLRASISNLGRNNIYLVSERGGSRAEVAAYLLCQAGLDAYILRDELPLQNAKIAS